MPKFSGTNSNQSLKILSHVQNRAAMVSPGHVQSVTDKRKPAGLSSGLLKEYLEGGVKLVLEAHKIVF